MPDLPHHVTTEEIEGFLDRTALEIEEAGAICLIPIFQWLELQLAAARSRASTLDEVRRRAAASKEKGRGNHSPHIEVPAR